MSDIDDIHDRIKELKKDMSDMASFFGKAMSDAERASNKIADTAKKSINITNLLQATINSSKDLRNNFDSVSDLQDAIAKDAKLFKTVQAQINNQLSESFQQMDNELQAQLALIDNDEERNKLLEKNQMIQMQISNDVAAQVAIVEKQVKQNNKNLLALENMKNVVDDLGDKIRNPAMIADQLIYKFGEISTKLFEARQEGKSFSKILTENISKALGGIASVAKSLLSPAGLFIVGFGLATAAAAVLFKLFTNFWQDLDENVIPAIADMNKQIGGTGNETAKLKSQAVGVGREFQSLGMSFSEGAALVGEFASGINSINLDRKTLQTGKEMVAILKVGGKEAGDFANQFIKQEGSIDGLNEAFATGASEAKAWGVPVNDVLRDMAESPDILARFGTANRKEFAIASAKARSYGLTLKEVNGVFGKTLDTFEGSSKAASNLNSIFGTTINSFELMLETDPTKRLEMLRGELENQGKSWDKLNTFEKNAITSTLQIDDKQAALVLSSEKVRKELEAKQRKEKELMRTEEKWNQGMGSIKRSLIEWNVEVSKLMREVTGLVAEIFGFQDPGTEMSNIADKLKGLFGDMSEKIRELKGNVHNTNTTFGVMIKVGQVLFKTFKLAGLGAVAVFKQVYEWVDNTVTALVKGIKYVADFMGSDLFKNIDPEKFGTSLLEGLDKKLTEFLPSDSIDVTSDSMMESQPIKTTKLKNEKDNLEMAELKKTNAELKKKLELAVNKKASVIEGQLELVSGGEKLGKFILKNAVQKSRS